MKVPTLLVLILLSLLVIAAVSTKSYLLKLLPIPISTNPQSIAQSNLSPDSITVSWLTDPAGPTQLIYTTDKSFLKDLKSAADDRDKTPQPRIFHFVTILDLQPQTTYYFKIGNSNPNQTQQFTTPANSENQNTKLTQLVGSVINSGLQPVPDALVVLEVSGYFPLAAYTGQGGNFVLPLKPVYKKDVSFQKLDLIENNDVSLTISKDNLTSHVDLQLNQSDQPLPPIVLGQNIDLGDYKPATGSAAATVNNNFDINGDGKINSVDLAIVQSNIGNKTFPPKTDVNGDGVVDQKDLDLLKQALK